MTLLASAFALRCSLSTVHCALFFAVPGTIRFGSLRLPVFGIYAACGLIAALALSERAARRAGLDADRVWDAGFAAAITAFVVSRVLLIATDLRGFLRYPLLILALPSLTWTGLLVTGIVTALWLRWRRLPVRAVADAWAPCACLLAAVLQWAHLREGTAAGMPTAMPWGVYIAGDYVFGRVQPVQWMAMACAAALGAWAWWRLPRRAFAGEAAAWTLLLGGIATFLLDFLRQPEMVLGGALPLDSAQIVALIAAVAGVWWLGLSPSGAQSSTMVVETD